jgi:hypothetical protein
MGLKQCAGVREADAPPSMCNTATWKIAGNAELISSGRGRQHRILNSANILTRFPSSFVSGAIHPMYSVRLSLVSCIQFTR